MPDPQAWKSLAIARGLHLPDADLDKLAGAMEAFAPATRALGADLTFDIEPVTTLGEEAVEIR